jgi:hypothetical protein
LIKKVLEEFVEETEKLYGAQTIKINIHQLLHIIDRDVENWGLLWTHNAFPYESMNGLFTQFVHRSQIIPKAAVFAFRSMQQLPIQEEGTQFSNEDAQVAFQKLKGSEAR